MNPLGPSWKTTATGITAILIALFHAADCLLNNKPVDYTVIGPSIMTGMGLLFARDNKVTSEQAGAAKPAAPAPPSTPQPP